MIAHGRHHFADRHRQEKRHHAGRFRAAGGTHEGLSAGRIDLPRLLHAFPADPDDHHGGAAWWRAADAGYRYRSELRQPLGYTIVGGLLLSQILTLYTTPVVYLYLDKLGAFIGQLRRRKLASSPDWGGAGTGRITIAFGPRRNLRFVNCLLPHRQACLGCNRHPFFSIVIERVVSE